MKRSNRKPVQGASRDARGAKAPDRFRRRKHHGAGIGAVAAAPSVKLQKRLADLGLGSRRAMEELIAAGEVTVNGARARVGMRVADQDQIVVRGEPVHIRPTASTRLPRIVLYHKPEGEIVTRRDPEGRVSVFDRAAFLRRGRWLAIGRLDFNTCGLLVFTDSGELANRLSHPRFQMRRDYAVRILGVLSPEQTQTLRSGVQLDDGKARFEVLEPQGGEGSNRWYRVRVREGRYRLVRRMFEALGLKVSRLMRIAFGPFELPPRVKRGQWLRLEASDVQRALQEMMPEGRSTGNAPQATKAKRPLPRASRAHPGREGIPRRRPHSSRPR